MGKTDYVTHLPEEKGKGESVSVSLGVMACTQKRSGSHTERFSAHIS